MSTNDTVRQISRDGAHYHDICWRAKQIRNVVYDPTERVEELLEGFCYWCGFKLTDPADPVGINP